MRITIFGSGYVGLVTGACLADAGNHVVCVDVDDRKIEMLKRGEVPIHEPGLDAMVKRNFDAGRLKFTTDAKEGISFAGLPITLPPSLLDMGITADQWAVLPPLVKKDLLNAAQQNGPPAYRQMMREYFAKVAKMQTTAEQP